MKALVYPRRVTTGPLKLAPAGGKSLRGGSYNYRLTRGAASYSLYAAFAKLR